MASPNALSSIVLLAMLGACTPVGNHSTPNQTSVSNVVEEERRIAAAEQSAAATDAAANTMETIKRPVVGETTEGGTAIGYFEGARLRKANVVLFGETFRATSDLYFNDKGSVTFVRELEERYDKPMYEPGFAVTKQIRRRYVFDDRVLVRLDEDGIVASRTQSEKLGNATSQFADRIAMLLTATPTSST